MLNPGSVGTPIGSGGKTQFLILHGDNGVWQEEFVSLEYDVDKAIRDMQEAGLYSYAPYWSKVTEHMLKGGHISHGTVLARAMEFCRDAYGECHWPQIPEECWQQAVEELLMTEG